MPRNSCVWVGVVVLLACSGAKPAAVPGSPALPAGFHPEPLPSENDSALGRVIDAPPAEGESILQASRVNPCSSFLEAARDSKQEGKLQGSQEVSADAAGDTLLAKYGFHASGAGVTTLVFRLEITNQLSVVEKDGYAACCQAKGGCGIGYISTLVHGSGEYAATKILAGEATADFVIARGQASLRLKAIERKQVRGYIAAAVTPTSFAPAPDASPETTKTSLADLEDPRLLQAARSQQSEAQCAYNSSLGTIRCQFANVQECDQWRGLVRALAWDCIPQPEKIWCRLDDDEQLGCYHYAAECDKRRVESCASDGSDVDQCSPQSCRKILPAAL